MSVTIKELETEGEFGKCVILFADDKGKYRAVDTVYDSKTGLVSLLVSRGHGKSTFTEEYTAAQTDTAIITPTLCNKLDIVGALIITDATTGDVYLTFATSGKTVMPLYAAAFKRSINDDMHVEGDCGEALTLNSTTGTSKVFVLVNYREIDCTCLTVPLFQANAATGTSELPQHINDNSTTTISTSDAINEYAEVDLGAKYCANKYRIYGSDTHNQDGAWKLQYYDDDTSTWIDWKTDIPTRLGSWSDWIDIPSKLVQKIRLVCTTVDTGLLGSRCAELEMKWS